MKRFNWILTTLAVLAVFACSKPMEAKIIPSGEGDGGGTVTPPAGSYAGGLLT